MLYICSTASCMTVSDNYNFMFLLVWYVFFLLVSFFLSSSCFVAAFAHPSLLFCSSYWSIIIHIGFVNILLAFVSSCHYFWPFWFTVCFFGVFTKLQKATVSFIMSVSPSVFPRGTTRLLLNGISWNLIFEDF